MRLLGADTGRVALVPEDDFDQMTIRLLMAGDFEKRIEVAHEDRTVDPPVRTQGLILDTSRHR